MVEGRVVVQTLKSRARNQVLILFSVHVLTTQVVSKDEGKSGAEDPDCRASLPAKVNR